MVRFDTRTTGMVLVVGLLSVWPSRARAELLNSSTGISNPAAAVTFDDVVLPVNTALTNQYASQGVTFAGLFYDSRAGSSPGPFPNVNGHYAGNFTNSGTNQTFTITLTTTQTSAAFALSAIQSGDITFTALLDGTAVETATAFADSSSATNFYGFTGTAFNAIQVDTGTTVILNEPRTRQVVIDNIQLGTENTVTPVPAPSGVVLMGSGLAGLLGFRVVRQKSSSTAAV